jgi:hypothetical protein
MPREDEDDFDYTTSDVGPREPDRFEKRGDPNNEGAEERRPDERREIRERG